MIGKSWTHTSYMSMGCPMAITCALFIIWTADGWIWVMLLVDV